jgi:hypothetical protein
MALSGIQVISTKSDDITGIFPSENDRRSLRGVCVVRRTSFQAVIVVHVENYVTTDHQIRSLPSRQQ